MFLKLKQDISCVFNVVDRQMVLWTEEFKNHLKREFIAGMSTFSAVVRMENHHQPLDSCW